MFGLLLITSLRVRPINILRNLGRYCFVAVIQMQKASNGFET